MKKILVIAAVNALALLGCTPVATADWADSRQQQSMDDHWQRNDHWQRGTDWRPAIRDQVISIRRAIHDGVENGQLTRHEADRARHELDAVLDEMDRMKSDGYLSERERERVLAQLDDVRRDVRRLRHNDRSASY